MTWLAAVGQKADTGGVRVLRGEASMSIGTWPRGLTRRRRASRRAVLNATGVTWLAALGQKADRRRARATRRAGCSGPFGGPGPDLSPAVGAVRPVVLDRFTRAGTGDGGEALPWHLAR